VTPSHKMRRVALALTCLVLAVTAAKIEHFIVVMMENRSFDHMCGLLNTKNPEIDGLTGKEFNVANGTKYYVQDTCPYINPFDPNHSFDHTTRQLMGHMTSWIDPAPMDGFALDHFLGGFPEYWTVMKGFSPERVPAISTLATEFLLFDKYFASVPGPTVSNRLYFHSGTSDGTVHGDYMDLVEGWPQETLMDVLTRANISWASYYGDVSDMLYLRNPRRPRNIVNLHPLDRFYTHLAEGQLPAYSWVSPQFYPTHASQAKDQHPDHDVIEGERFMAEVYAAVRASPLWNKTAILFTYDEHGGFYDHVSPPTGVPNPDGKNATDDFIPFNFTREGVRVCSILASPLVPKGKVVHEAPSGSYEHGSIYRTLQNLWGFEEAPITKRYAWAHPMDDLFSLDEPRTDCPMTVPTPATTPERSEAVLNEQRLRAPNGLQRELYKMVESLFGRDGKDVDRFKTQEEMGSHVTQWHQKFIAQQLAKAEANQS